MLGLGSSISTVPYVEGAAPRTLIASYDFNDDTGSVDGSSATLPSGWEKADSGNFTLFGSTTDDNLGASQDTVGWIFGHSQTGSLNTGVGGGHIPGPDTLETVVTSGVWGATTARRYMYYEASSFGSSTTSVKAGAIRSNELDFSGFSTVTMTFWFHAFGAAFGGNYGTAVAATTSATSSSSAVEAGSGLGLTSATAGGATISYTDLGGTDDTTVRIGHNGQIQTTGHTTASDPDTNYWIKATVDLSAAAGQSSVYIHFVHFANTGNGGQAYFQDTCIDSIAIIGE